MPPDAGQGTLDRVRKFGEQIGDGGQKTETAGDHHIAKGGREIGAQGRAALIIYCRGKDAAPRPGDDDIEIASA